MAYITRLHLYKMSKQEEARLEQEAFELEKADIAAQEAEELAAQELEDADTAYDAENDDDKNDEHRFDNRTPEQ